MYLDYLRRLIKTLLGVKKKTLKREKNRLSLNGENKLQVHETKPCRRKISYGNFQRVGRRHGLPVDGTRSRGRQAAPFWSGRPDRAAGWKRIDTTCIDDTMYMVYTERAVGAKPRAGPYRAHLSGDKRFFLHFFFYY